MMTRSIALSIALISGGVVAGGLGGWILKPPPTAEQAQAVAKQAAAEQAELSQITAMLQQISGQLEPISQYASSAMHTQAKRASDVNEVLNSIPTKGQ